MSTNQSNKEAWRKFLGIKDPSATLESGRVGGSIGRTAGRSGGGGGGGELDSDSVPEGEEEEGAEKGDGAADAGKQLKPGDNADRLEDLYDCETVEEVTIDWLGEKGSERYPTGFENCDGQKKPTLDELIQNNVTIYRNTIHYSAPSSQPPSIDYYYASLSSAQSGLPALKSSALAYANSKSQHGCVAKIVPPSSGMLYGAWSQWKGGVITDDAGKLGINEFMTSR